MTVGMDHEDDLKEMKRKPELLKLANTLQKNLVAITARHGEHFKIMLDMPVNKYTKDHILEFRYGFACLNDEIIWYYCQDVLKSRDTEHKKDLKEALKKVVNKIRDGSMFNKPYISFSITST